MTSTNPYCHRDKTIKVHKIAFAVKCLKKNVSFESNQSHFARFSIQK